MDSAINGDSTGFWLKELVNCQNREEPDVDK
jgi:hypothetical protein